MPGYVADEKKKRLHQLLKIPAILVSCRWMGMLALNFCN